MSASLSLNKDTAATGLDDALELIYQTYRVRSMNTVRKTMRRLMAPRHVVSGKLKFSFAAHCHLLYEG